MNMKRPSGYCIFELIFDNLLSFTVGGVRLINGFTVGTYLPTYLLTLPRDCPPPPSQCF